MILYQILEGVVCFFLVSPFAFIFFSLLVSKLKSKKEATITKFFDFACIITAYKDASIAENAVHSLLSQKHENFIVYLVADDCDTSGLNFTSEKVVVLKPQKALKSKVKSIEYAISHFTRSHDTIAIFDPDNLAHPTCLVEMNIFFNRGYKAVQGRRTAKNLDTFYACLDAVGEYYYNYTHRQVPFSLGSSASLAGSGMAFILQDYVDFLNQDSIKQMHVENKVIVAEDKMLQVDLVKKGNVIAYAKEAIIYDEKVVSGTQVQRQRTRWLNSYFLHLKDGLGLLATGLVRLNFNQIFFAYTVVIPPMFLLVCGTFLLLFINLFYSVPQFILVLGAFFIFASSFLLTLYLGNAPSQVWKSLWRLPFFVSKQILALLDMKKSNKDFLVTEKKSNAKLEDLMQTKH